MRCGIRKRIDDFQLLDNRAGPAMRDDERQGVLLFRADMNEMNVEPIDFSDEVRQRIEPRLAFAPIVLGPPITRERLHRRELHALGLIRNQLAFWPAGRVYAPLQFGKFRIRKPHPEGTNGALIGTCLSCIIKRRHGRPPAEDKAPPRGRAEVARRKAAARLPLRVGGENVILVRHDRMAGEPALCVVLLRRIIVLVAGPESL